MLKLCVFNGLATGLIGLLSLVGADPIKGDATFTGGNIGGGTCSFANYSFLAGLSGTGIGPSNWATGGKCGACLRVNGPKGSVRVMVQLIALQGEGCWTLC